MRTKLLGLLLGCGLIAAAAAPVLACPFHTEASNSQVQYTAQTQTGAETATQ